MKKIKKYKSFIKNENKVFKDIFELNEQEIKFNFINKPTFIFYLYNNDIIFVYDKGINYFRYNVEYTNSNMSLSNMLLNFVKKYYYNSILDIYPINKKDLDKNLKHIIKN